MITASNVQTSVSDRSSPIRTSIVDGVDAPVEIGASRKRSRAPLLLREERPDIRQLGHFVICWLGVFFLPVR